MLPQDLRYKDPKSKYDALYPEIEEVLGPTQNFEPCTLVWRDLTVHVKLKDGKQKRLVNNGMFYLINTLTLFSFFSINSAYHVC